MLNKEENLFGIIQPFRKLTVLLNIFLIGATTHWAFKFATEALESSETHFLHVATITTAIYAPLIYLTKGNMKLYWEGRK